MIGHAMRIAIRLRAGPGDTAVGLSTKNNNGKSDI